MRSTALAMLLICCLLVGLASAETVTLGPVSANVMINPQEPVIGDLVTLSLTVTAEPDVEVLMPEFGEALERFSITDFVPRERIEPSGVTVATQEYRLQPNMSGQQSIPPLLIEFVDRRPGQRSAPDGHDAYELLTPRLDFEVQSVIPVSAFSTTGAQGQTSGSPPNGAGGSVSGQGWAQPNALKPPLGELKIPQPIVQRRSTWVIVGGAVGLLAVGAIVLARLRRAPPAITAYEFAHRRLTALRQRPLPGTDELDPFFVELSDIVRSYLEQRFELRAPELTTEEFLEIAASSPDLSAKHQQMLRAFLQQADLVKFAGLQPAENDIRAALQAAAEFVEETRDDAVTIGDAAGEPVHA